jgi:HEAT repeat protein
VLALVGLAADVALGHGGVFTGPRGGGTPTFGGPHGGTSGGTGGPTGGGGGEGGTTPGVGGGGGFTPGGGGGPPRPGAGPGRGGANRGGSTQGRTKATKDERIHDWDWWWELNDDQFLMIKDAIRKNTAATSGADVLFGRTEGGDVATVTTRVIRDQILPAVRYGMKDPFFDARAGAVIAAGKVADPTLPDLATVAAEIKALLADPDKSVRESACLGLGVLGSKAAVPVLLQIVKNSPEARLDTGRGTRDVEIRQRAFAAVAIGLIGAQDALDGSVVADLVAQLKRDEAHPDLQVFPALALGIMRSPNAVPELRALVANLDADEIVRAHAIIALGKLGDRSYVSWLATQGLTDRKVQVERSSAIALGLLTDRDDQATIEILMSHAKSAADRAVKNFSLIALGQIGSQKARDFLVSRLKSGQPHDRTFAALALGVYGHKSADDRADLGRLLVDAWTVTKNDSERGAFAIALGLLEHEAAAPLLMEELRAGGSPDLKGHVATALGLMGVTSAIPMIQELAKNVSDLDTQRRASIALGLIGDPEAVPVLVKVIEDAGHNLSALGGAAVALGFIGDRRAVPTMSAMLLEREKFKDNARAFAAVALGILGDKGRVSILSKVQENCNYLATTEGLNEILLIY